VSIEKSSLIDDHEDSVEMPPQTGGHIRFYGLFWLKSEIDWDSGCLLGQPDKWLGKGKVSETADRSQFQMNFWDQKGVYILYNQDLYPVYAGQAGLTKSTNGIGGTIGDRLNDHRRGSFRHGWSLFSWFGFLDTEQLNLRSAETEARTKPRWTFGKRTSGMNELLASFEAIIIEGFVPRFNARGGDLKDAVVVTQFETPKIMQT
jgi:hypothetical protein